MTAAAAGMGVALWGMLILLGPALTRATFEGTMALLAACVVGAVAYAALGAALGVMRLSELRFVMRRQPGLRSADPDEQP